MLKILRKVLTVNRNYGQYNHLRSYARLLKPDIESMHATVVYSFVEYVGASGSSLSWNNQHTLILLFAKRFVLYKCFFHRPTKVSLLYSEHEAHTSKHTTPHNIPLCTAASAGIRFFCFQMTLFSKWSTEANIPIQYKWPRCNFHRHEAH